MDPVICWTSSKDGWKEQLLMSVENNIITFDLLEDEHDCFLSCLSEILLFFHIIRTLLLVLLLSISSFLHIHPRILC